MPDRPFEPTEHTDPTVGVAADPLVQRLLDLVEQQMTDTRETTTEQLESQARTLKWSFAMTMICLVAICGLSGVNLAINAGFIDVSTTADATMPEARVVFDTGAAEEMADDEDVDEPEAIEAIEPATDEAP